MDRHTDRHTKSQMQLITDHPTHASATTIAGN